jgi:hypothetical protein
MLGLCKITPLCLWWDDDDIKSDVGTWKHVKVNSSFQMVFLKMSFQIGSMFFSKLCVCVCVCVCLCVKYKRCKPWPTLVFTYRHGHFHAAKRSWVVVTGTIWPWPESVYYWALSRKAFKSVSDMLTILWPHGIFCIVCRGAQSHYCHPVPLRSFFLSEGPLLFISEPAPSTPLTSGLGFANSSPPQLFSWCEEAALHTARNTWWCSIPQRCDTCPTQVTLNTYLNRWPWMQRNCLFPLPRSRGSCDHLE